MIKAAPISIDKLSSKATNQLFYGARNGSKRALERLFNAVEPRIKKYAHHYGNTPILEQDLYMKGCETFVEIINSKTPVQKAKNYLLKYIKQDIWGECHRISKRKQRFISLENVINSENIAENSTVTIATTLKNSQFQSNPHKMIDMNEVLGIVKGLSQRQQQIFFAKIFSGETSKELSKKLGISIANVDKSWERTKNTLQKLVKKKLRYLSQGFGVFLKSAQALRSCC